MIFKQLQTKANVLDIKKLAADNGLCYKTAQILSQRGIDTNQKLHKFLNPSIENFRDPFLLDGMAECKARIAEAIQKDQSILLYGDYDVDGISAVAILHKFLKDKVSTINYFLPNRYEDGYGLTLQTAKKVIEQFEPDLIITVDCGITCVEEVEYIKAQNVDIIITDHHEPLDILPKTIVIDPKIKGQAYGFDGLCGAGVALKVVQAMVGKINLMPYLPICAIATVSDIVPLVDENRDIVKIGLANQKELPAGIRRLVKNLKLSSINSQAISFKIAPRLNASGRMGNAYIALNLFLNENKNVINQSLETMNEQNTKRQLLSQQIYEDCLEQINTHKLYQQNAILLKSDKWDSGLLGIACARLVDDFCKPVFLFSEVDGMLKGSVRSVGEINIHTVLTNCSNCLATFGGHSMAAGLALTTQMFEPFCEQVFDYLAKNTTAKDYLPIRYYDVELKAEDINMKFATELELLEPFGCDNPTPQFLIKYEKCRVSKLANFENHLNITTDKNCKFLQFNAQEYFDDYIYAQTKHSIIDLQINEFRGKKSLKGLVKYTNFYGADKSLQQVASGRMLKQFVGETECDKKISFINKNQVKNLLKQLVEQSNGTAVVIYNLSTYYEFQKTLSEFDLVHFVGSSQSKTAENCVVFALDNPKKLNNYNNILFLDGLLTRSFAAQFEANVFAVNSNAFSIEKLNTERDYFGQIFKAIKLVLQNAPTIKDELQFFRAAKETTPTLKNMSFSQFVFSLYVFDEIGVLTVCKEPDFKVCVNNGIKSNLEKSTFYNKIKLIQKIK